MLRPDGPIPDLTRDLPEYLRACFPELTPRSTSQVENALMRGAQLELIEWLEYRLDEDK
jgi:hypothetical protein